MDCSLQNRKFICLGMARGFSFLRLRTMNSWQGQHVAVGFHTVTVGARSVVGHLWGHLDSRKCGINEDTPLIV